MIALWPRVDGSLVTELYDVVAMPSTVLIDRDGPIFVPSRSLQHSNRSPAHQTIVARAAVGWQWLAARQRLRHTTGVSGGLSRGRGDG